jgi:replicative DNA helicase
MWGKDVIDEEEYQRHIQGLKNTPNKFMVATPADFDKKITVSKLKKWIEQHKLDMIAIDGITYMTDERSKRGDNKTTSLTNISEDLMELSMEMKVPVLVVVQANRGGVVEKGSTETPELENIRDSDGIAHNASKILSLRQISPGVIVFIVKKQRMGPVGGKLIYNWDIDRGLFNFIPSYEDAQPKEETVKRVAEVKSQYKDKSDVF